MRFKIPKISVCYTEKQYLEMNHPNEDEDQWDEIKKSKEIGCECIGVNALIGHLLIIFVCVLSLRRKLTD